MIEAPKEQAVARPLLSTRSQNETTFRARGWMLALLTIILIVCFGRPLIDLADYARKSSLYSHILLIPFISMYLLWLKRRTLPAHPVSWPWLAALPFLAGVALLAGYWLGIRSGWKPAVEDYLACMTFAFLFLLLSGCWALLGTKTLRAFAFPAAFLIFMAPFPTVVLHWIESFFQHTSAEAAYWLLTLSGMPVFRNGTEFQLPGFAMEVAPECSGIHSSLVLFITSLLAGHLLLRTTWARTVLALAVIALGILRNGARIFTLGQLCVHAGPRWIDSDLHHRGGPLFFVLSLVPLFLLLLYLRKRESRRGIPKTTETGD